MSAHNILSRLADNVRRTSGDDLDMFALCSGDPNTASNRLNGGRDSRVFINIAANGSNAVLWLLDPSDLESTSYAAANTV